MFVAGLALRPMAESDLFFRIKAGEEILRAGRAARAQPVLVHLPRPSRPRQRRGCSRSGSRRCSTRGGFRGDRRREDAAARGRCSPARSRCAGGAAPGRWPSALVLAAAALRRPDRFVERPHLFSLAGVVALLFRHRRADRGRRGRTVAVRASCWRRAVGRAVGQPARGRVRGASAAGVRGGWGAARSCRRRGAPAGIAALVAAAARAGHADRRRHLPLPAPAIDVAALHPVDEFRAPTLAVRSGACRLRRRGGGRRRRGARARPLSSRAGGCCSRWSRRGAGRAGSVRFGADLRAGRGAGGRGGG